MLSNYTNFAMLNKYFDECDVVVCPDNDLLMYLCFLSHWKGKPLLSSTHTNFKVLLEGGSFISKYVAAPTMDSFVGLISHLATETWTTSPSYKEVLDTRGYSVKGVFSPRIKLAVFDKPDPEEEIKKARMMMKGASRADVVLLSVGRWSHEKRLNLLAKAVPENCVLAIFGDGPEEEATKVEALHDPSSNVYVFRGMVNQERLRVLYKAADFLVSASAFETLGMTVAESHLCGTPVIVQNAAGFISQVVQNENGFLVDFEAPDIRSVVKSCVERKPKKKQIAKTVEKRWDSSLPNLEIIDRKSVV